MLEITVGGQEAFDEKSQTFLVQGGTQLVLEHSLVSLSKWESRFEKPFLGQERKTSEEVLGYIKAMTLNFPPGEIYEQLSEENIKAINEYIVSKQTATWFDEAPGAAPRSREIITAELIYYWMIAFNIPIECENWHINRLFTLIRVCNLQASKPEKLSRAEVAARNRALNAQRKKQLGTKG